jgi:hypothetical protein
MVVGGSEYTIIGGPKKRKRLATIQFLRQSIKVEVRQSQGTVPPFPRQYWA